MKSILLICSLAFLVLPFHAQKGIVYAPCSIPDSCGVVYTHKQDERCLLTFIKCERQDSLIALYDNQIKRADAIMYEQLNTINEQTNELKRRRKNVYKAGFGGVLGGFFVGLVTWGLVLIN